MKNIQSNSDKQLDLKTVFNWIFIYLVLLSPSVFLGPPQGKVFDLPEFYASARMILAGQGGQIYSPEAIRVVEQQFFAGQAGQVFYIPPPAAWLVSPLGLFNPIACNIFWPLILILAVCGSLFLLQRSYNLSNRTMLWAAVALVYSGPEWESIRHGQLAPLLLLALCLALYFEKKNKTVLCAAALSLLLLKPQYLLPLFVFLLGAGRLKLVLYLVLDSVILAASSLIVLGKNCYIEYYNLLHYSAIHREWMKPEVGPTIRGQLLRFFPTADAQVLILSSILTAAFLLLCFWMGRHWQKHKNLFELGLLSVLPGSMLTALHCHNYDLLLLLPTCFVLCQCWRIKTFQPLVCKSFLSLLLFMLPIYSWIHYYYLLRGGIINPLFFSLVVFSWCCAIAAIKLVKENGAG